MALRKMEVNSKVNLLAFSKNLEVAASGKERKKKAELLFPS